MTYELGHLERDAPRTIHSIPHKLRNRQHLIKSTIFHASLLSRCRHRCRRRCRRRPLQNPLQRILTLRLRLPTPLLNLLNQLALPSLLPHFSPSTEPRPRNMMWVSRRVQRSGDQRRAGLQLPLGRDVRRPDLAGELDSCLSFYPLERKFCSRSRR